MSFKISLTNQTPDTTALPVLKVNHYPLEPRDYKPFCQTSIFIDHNGFNVRMWAFETPPEQCSTILGVFNLFPSYSKDILSIKITPEEAAVKVNEKEFTDLCEIDRFCGEDLQGIYWGALITVPAGLIADLFPNCSFVCGQHIKCNIFKLCEGNRPHSGSYFPFDFPKTDYCNIDKLREIEIINY